MKLTFSSIAIAHFFAFQSHGFAPINPAILPPIAKTFTPHRPNSNSPTRLRAGGDDLSSFLNEYKSTVSSASSASSASTAPVTKAADVVTAATTAASAPPPPPPPVQEISTSASATMDAISEAVDAAKNAADTAAAAATAVTAKVIPAKTAAGTATAAAASKTTAAAKAGAVTTGVAGFQFRTPDWESNINPSTWDFFTNLKTNLVSSGVGASGAGSATDGATSGLSDVDLPSIYATLTPLIETLHLKEYGGWYAAFAFALTASQQRTAGRDEATKEFEEELTNAREKASEAASAAGLAAEGARKAKELALRMEATGANGKDGSSSLLEESKMKQLQIEKDIMEKELRRVKDELNTLRNQLQTTQQQTANGDSDLTTQKLTEIEEEYPTKITMERDPNEDVMIIELLKELDEENKLKKEKEMKAKAAELELKREEEAKYLAAEKKKAAAKGAEKGTVAEKTVAKKSAAKKAKSKAKRKTAKKATTTAAATVSDPSPEPTASDTDNEWSSLTDSALKRKTVAQLTEYLTERGVEVTDDSGKVLKKAVLLEAVRAL